MDLVNNKDKVFHALDLPVVENTLQYLWGVL